MIEIIKLLLSYGFVFCMVTINIFVCCIFGLFPMRLINGIKKIDSIFFIHSFWIGYAIFLSLLMGLNLFLPIHSIYTIIFLILLCVIILIVDWNILKEIKILLFTRRHIIIYIALVIISILLFRSKFSGNYAFDMYNYHFQLLRMVENYPVIKGVANIFGNYGNTYLTTFHAAFISIFNVKEYFSGYLFFTIPVIYITVLFIHAYIHIRGMLYTSKNLTTTNIYTRFYVYFPIILVLILLNYKLDFGQGDALYYHIPDINFYLLSGVFFLYFFKSLQDMRKDIILVLVSLSLIIVFNKLSSIILVISVMVLVTHFWFVKKQKITVFAVFMFVAFALFSPYILNTYIKTGALLFPIKFTDMNTPWSNIDNIKNYVYGARGFARFPSDYSKYLRYTVFNIWSWVPGWIVRNSMYFVTLGIWALLGLMLFITKKYKDIQEQKEANTLIVNSLIVFATSSIFWFLSAPDIRFAGILFLFPIIFLFSLAFTKTIIKNQYMHRFSQILLAIAIFFLLAQYISIKEFFMITFFLSSFYFIYSYHQKNESLSITKIINPHTKTGNILLLVFLLLNFSLVLDDSYVLKRIYLQSNEKNLVAQEYDGVIYYKGQWKNGYLCGYTKLTPCSSRIYKNYTWIDSSQWWKGMVKRDLQNK